MSGSKKISELTTATVLDGSELIPIVQQGETRQVDISLLGAFAPVLRVNGQAGLVVLALGDLAGEDIIRNEIVSATFTSVNAAHTSVVDAITSINTVITSVNDAATSTNAAITSVQDYLLAQLSVAVSGVFTEAPNDGQVYGRQSLAWTPLAFPYDIVFDFGSDTIPAGQELSIYVSRDILIPANYSGSGGQALTFPSTSVTLVLSHNTSTIGRIVVDVSGTATYITSTTDVAISVNAGDYLVMAAPAVSDSTLAQAFFTLAATRR